mmetsp:Transcript_36750/g.78030  ORF Transcript_36750/g.78030 Transcript_36750/m.78030 type:complete len:254 (-) Transcript_36750:835-1596(-)
MQWWHCCSTEDVDGAISTIDTSDFFDPSSERSDLQQLDPGNNTPTGSHSGKLSSSSMTPRSKVRAPEDDKYCFHLTFLKMSPIHMILEPCGVGLRFVGFPKGTSKDTSVASLVLRQRLKQHDVIVRINGECHHEQMAHSLVSSASATLTLEVVRPILCRISIHKDEKAALGAGLSYRPGFSCVDLATVHIGAISKHNEKAGPEGQLEVNDFLISVNGISEEPDNMIKALQTSTRVDLLVAQVSRAWLLGVDSL